MKVETWVTGRIYLIMTTNSKNFLKINIDQNKSFCSYPFTHSYIGSLYERKLCCVSEDIDELKKTSLSEFWNSDKLKQVRKDMIAGKPVKECSRCYYFEQINVPSLRQEATKDALFNINSEYILEDGTMTIGPSYFDHRTIHCNFQCLSCGWHYSSSHIALKEEMWNSKTDFTIDYNYEKQSGQDIIDSLRKKECKNIYWAGGEPFMSHVHWMVVEEMYNLSQDSEYADYIKNIRVHYNTNLSKSVWKNKKIVDLLEFYQPSIQASIDGTHETFEYCRDGGNWADTEKNWKEFYLKLNKNKQMGVASVLSAPVIFDIDRWFDFFEQYDPALHNHKYICAIDSYPDRVINFLDIRLYPKSICEDAIHHAIERFEKCNLRHKAKSIQILKSYLIEREEHRDIFEDQKILKIVKTRCLYRDEFLKTKRPFGELLEIINKRAAHWYRCI